MLSVRRLDAPVVVSNGFLPVLVILAFQLVPIMLEVIIDAREFATWIALPPRFDLDRLTAEFCVRFVGKKRQSHCI